MICRERLNPLFRKMLDDFWWIFVLQGPVHHWSKRCGEAHECEWPASGALCRRDPSLGEGVPVCGDPRRGVSSQLDPWVPNGEFLQPLIPSVRAAQNDIPQTLYSSQSIQYWKWSVPSVVVAMWCFKFYFVVILLVVCVYMFRIRNLCCALKCCLWESRIGN